MDDKTALVDFDFCAGESLGLTVTSAASANQISEIVCTNGNVSSGIHSISEDVSETSLHCHRPPARRNTTARNQLIIVSILCLTFMLIEVIGGILSNSLALVTDATHLASDLSSFLFGLFAIWLAQKPATPRMSFGFHRAEVLGALVSILIIWVLTGILLYMAVDRLINPDYEIDATQMLIVAVLGVAFNIVMGIVLSGACSKCKIEHSHFGTSHGHSHSRDEDSNNNNNDKHSHSHKNMNIRAALIHVIGDLVQSIGVLIAAIIIRVNPDYKIADPICTFVFSLLVLITTVTVMRDIFFVFMEASPKKIEYSKMRKSLEGINGVKSVHSLHVWALTMNKMVMSVHLAIDDDVHYNHVVKRASRILTDVYGGYHVTVQVEPYQEDIMNSCNQCLGPKSL